MSAPGKDPAAVDAGDTSIHFAALAMLHRLGGDKLVREIIDVFIASAPQLINAAHTGAVSGECEQVKRALHSLKSSAGQLGAMQMQRLCSEGEMLAAHGDRLVLPSLVLELEVEFAIARRHLEAVTARGELHLVTYPQ